MVQIPPQYRLMHEGGEQHTALAATATTAFPFTQQVLRPMQATGARLASSQQQLQQLLGYSLRGPAEQLGFHTGGAGGSLQQQLIQLAPAGAGAVLAHNGHSMLAPAVGAAGAPLQQQAGDAADLLNNSAGLMRALAQVSAAVTAVAVAVMAVAGAVPGS